jgi:magnesium transporter
MRKRLVKKSGKKAGSSPGTLIHVGEKKMEEVGIRVIGYDGETLEDHIILAEEVAKCCELKAKPTVAWVNVDGIHRIEVIESLGKCFELHPLVMEDILNTEHRPKLEEYPDYLFLVLKMLLFDEAKGEEIRTEQVSLILGKNFVLSFQECEGDVFNGVR